MRQVYDLIRGTNPAPGAWAMLNGAELGVFDCARLPGDGPSGKIMEVSAEGVIVQCIGGRIQMKRVRPAGEGKVAASEWAASAGIAAGDRFDD